MWGHTAARFEARVVRTFWLKTPQQEEPPGVNAPDDHASTAVTCGTEVSQMGLQAHRNVFAFAVHCV